MNNLFDFLKESYWDQSTSTFGDVNYVPAVDSGQSVMNGKIVDVDVEKLKGKSEDFNDGRFALDPPTDNDVYNFDGEPKMENVKAVLRQVAANHPFFVIGHAGWGKSDIIKQAAKKYGKTVIVVNIDKIPPEDLGGIDVPMKGPDGRVRRETLLPTWAQYMHDHPETDFLLFFDEMNQASGETQNALMPIIKDHVIAGYPFNNYVAAGAGNFHDENDYVNAMSDPIISRLQPIIVWKDQDPESWEEYYRYQRKKWKDAFPGSNDLLDLIDKYKHFFESPRVLDEKIFAWVNDIFKVAKKTNIEIDPDVFDRRGVEDVICTCMVHQVDPEILASQKRELMEKSDTRRAIETIAEAIINILFRVDAATDVKSNSSENGSRSTFSNDSLQKFIKWAQDGCITYPETKDGKRPKDSDTIIVSRDNLADLCGFIKQQIDQIEVAMGDPEGEEGYAWQTEKEAKRKHPKWLTYKEACKKYPELA